MTNNVILPLLITFCQVLTVIAGNLKYAKKRPNYPIDKDSTVPTLRLIGHWVIYPQTFLTHLVMIGRFHPLAFILAASLVI